MRMTSASGELTSMRCSMPASPFRPGLNGSSQTVRRPFRQSSITRTGSPPRTSSVSRIPGHRCSNEKPAPRAGNNAPGQRVAVDQNLLHRARLDPRIPPRMPRRICLPSWLPTVRAVCLAIVSTMPWRRFVPQRNSSTLDGACGAPAARSRPLQLDAPVTCCTRCTRCTWCTVACSASRTPTRD